jgi:hypothetical protein
MNEKTEDRSGGAKLFSSIVYIGGVLAATVLFITFVLSAFPPDAYFTRFIMTAAGVAVGCSMLAFPYALEHWAITKKHRTITAILYYIEMGFIAVNTIVSFVNLLAKYANYAPPEWSILYEPFSILSLIYVVAAWGTVFLTDPAAKRKAQEREFQEQFEQGIADTKMEFLKSDEGRAAIANAAVQDIQLTITKDRTSKPFLRGDSSYVIDPEKGFVKKQLQAPPFPVITDEGRRRSAWVRPGIKTYQIPAMQMFTQAEQGSSSWEEAARACRECDLIPEAEYAEAKARGEQPVGVSFR